jgi:hypothetical protein
VSQDLESSNREDMASGQRTILLLAAGGAILGLLISCLLLSDNLQSLSESTAYDRLVLGQRTFVPGDGKAPWPRWDTNFPLGTAAVFSLPYVLGADPVLFGRLHSLFWALVGLLVVGALARRAVPTIPSLLVVLAVAGLPAFVRGAVVSGESAPATALLGIATLALCAGSPGVPGRSSGRRSWLIASLLAVNAMVLFRIDLMLVVPGLALLGLWRIRGRAGLGYAAGCGGSSALHLLLARATGGGSAWDFAHTAQLTTARSADGFGGVAALSDMLRTLANQLAGPWLGWPLLALTLLGGASLLRSGEGPRGRLLALVWLWTLVAYQAACLSGVLEARSPRYLVPLLALSCPLLLHGTATLTKRFAGRHTATVLALVTATAFFSGAWTAVSEAREARLPSGLVDCASALGELAGDGHIMIAERHPVVVVHSGLPYSQTSVLPPPGPQPVDAAGVLAAMQSSGARWLLAFPDHPPSSALTEPSSGLVVRKGCGQLQVLELTTRTDHSPM